MGICADCQGRSGNVRPTPRVHSRVCELDRLYGDREFMADAIIRFEREDREGAAPSVRM